MLTRERFSLSRRGLLIGGANIIAAGTFLSALGRWRKRPTPNRSRSDFFIRRHETTTDSTSRLPSRRSTLRNCLA